MTAFSRIEQRTVWSDAEVTRLRQMVNLELPMSYIARKLNRPEALVRHEARRVAIADMMRWPAPGPGRPRPGGH